MTDSSLSADELAALRRRWEEGASPQLAIQLAEAHKRRSEPQQAAEVLERALADQPSHLALRVAAGRLRLELGDLSGAADELEQVVERDPTHLVANKLLVRVYSSRGEPSRARDRLDLYRLLNESDPEIGELEALVPPEGVVEVRPEEERSAQPVSGAEPSKPSPESLPEASSTRGSAAARTDEPEPASEDAVKPAPESAAGSPNDELVEEARLDRPAKAARAESRPPEAADPLFAPAAADQEQPFPDLWNDLDTAGYWRQIGGGGIFGDSEPAAESVTAPLFEGPEPEPDPSSPVLDEDAAVEPPPVEHARPGVAAEPTPARRVEEERGGAASVTLAALYHQQGHTDEAKRTYREVLDREPDNREALNGLSRLARSRPKELTAFDLVGDEFPADPALRKSRVLEAYLARVREREAADV